MSARVLFLTTVAPHRRSSGGEVVSQAFVDGLRAAGHDVLVVGYSRPDDGQPPAGTLLAGARHIETDSAPLTTVAPWMAGALAHRLPYSVAKYRSEGYVERVSRLLERESFDAIVIDHAQTGWLMPVVEGAAPRLVLLAHNVEHLVYAERAQHAGSPLARALYKRESRAARSLEERLARAATDVWTLTAADAMRFRRLGAGNVAEFAVPSAVKPRAAETRRPKRFDVGLIGTWSWRPNRDALRFFVDEVRPRLPDTMSVEVAGRGAQWLAGAHGNVRYRGPVPDARAFMATARSLAIPCVGGGGIQVKTLDAIASGTRVVAMPGALRGISDPPETVRVCVDAAEFAHGIREAAAGGRSHHAKALEWSEVRRERFLTELALRIHRNADAIYRGHAGAVTP
ncbi:MAG: glycosyltransferase [Thermoleophilaceae bacterium]